MFEAETAETGGFMSFGVCFAFIGSREMTRNQRVEMHQKFNSNLGKNK